MSLLALDGLQVLDLTSGPAGGLATMILADFGASVTRVIDQEYDELNNTPSARMWLRGKSIADTIVFADVDALVISHPHSHAGCDYAHCAAVNPALIYCEISAMGPDVNLPMYDAVVAAKAGRMKQLETILWDEGPCFSAVQASTHTTAMNIVSGILAALHKRRHIGVGEKISTTLLQGLMPYDMGLSLQLQLNAQNYPERPLRPQQHRMPPLYYHPVQCADGKWLQLGNLLPHLFESYMRRIGLGQEMTGLPDTTEDVRDKILLTMQSKTRDEWMDIFIKDGGIAAHGYLEPAETLNDPDMTLNGHSVTLNGIKQLGPLATLSETPAKVTLAAKAGKGWRVKPQGVNRAAPLKDVTVIELATIIASPLGASFLADMGARVIKVEAIGGDPFRSMPGYGSIRCNQGKESICIDLKSDSGQKIVRELISKADILIHNYRPGVPERLGIGYEQLHALCPKLIYVSANGYGPAGPGAKRPSTHPIPGAAMGGAGYQAGGLPRQLLDIPQLREAARRLMSANEVNPDPNTASVVCASALIGLTAREQTGKGQKIFVDMFGANAYANFDAMVDYPGKPQRPKLGPDLKGPHPLYRLYPASDGWIFLGIQRRQEWQAFCSITENTWLTEFDNPLESNERRLVDELLAFFSGKTAQEWENAFANTPVACVTADERTTAQFFFGDCRENSDWMMKVPYPELDSYYRHKPMVSFAGSDPPECAPESAGGHTRSLMRELHYSDADIESYFAAGTLWQE